MAVLTAGLTAGEVLAKLLEGNRRMCEGGGGVPFDTTLVPYLDDEGQHPMATVVTCSDSRVPPELIFGCGLGELFVVRSAGNVLSAVGMGSVEYGAGALGTPLVLVMGHSHCGAVAGAAEGEGGTEGCLAQLLGQLTPSLHQAEVLVGMTPARIPLAEDLNIRRTAGLLREDDALRRIPGLLVAAA